MRTIGKIAVVLSLFSSAAFGTEYRKETTLAAVEGHATRPISPGTQNREFLSFSAGGLWTVHGGSGGVACPETAAVLPADNAVLRAIALTAIASGATVFVVVDSNLPTVAGVCQVTLLSIKAN